MIAAPSQQKRHILVWEGDGALNRPPPGDELAKKEFESRLAVANETGNYTDLLRAGDEPTRFHVKPIAGSVMRRLLDDVGAMSGPRFFATIFRVGIKKIESPDIPVEFESDRALGEVAKESVVDALDAINPSIVTDLGRILFQRASAPSGK